MRSSKEKQDTGEVVKASGGTQKLRFGSWPPCLFLGLLVLPSIIGEELAEVHFRVATPGQELFCYILDFSVVLKNFGGKKLLLQFIFLMFSKFLQCTFRIKNIPVKAQLGVQGLVRILWSKYSFHAGWTKRPISGEMKGKTSSATATCWLITYQPAIIVLFDAMSNVHDQFVAQLYHEGEW